MKFHPKLFSATGIFCTIILLHACLQKNSSDSVPVIKDSLKAMAGNVYAGIDQSPMDVSFYPPDYPQEKMSTPENTAPPVARIIYSRPHKKNRIIFSDNEKSLCPYGKLWRLGANEATEIEFFQPVVINEKNIPAGRYILYCIPFADKWVVALNNNLYSWGLKIDTTQDLMRTEVPVQKQHPVIEDFTIVFQPASYGADLLMTWDDVKTLLPITFSK
jgi:hypothetical protein